MAIVLTYYRIFALWADIYFLFTLLPNMACPSRFVSPSHTDVRQAPREAVVNSSDAQKQRRNSFLPSLTPLYSGRDTTNDPEQPRRRSQCLLPLEHQHGGSSGVEASTGGRERKKKEDIRTAPIMADLHTAYICDK